MGIIDAHRPAADIDLMGAVIESLAGAVEPEPVPVIGMNVVRIGPARRGTLPKFPIELRRHGNYLPESNRLSCIGVPAFAEAGRTDQSIVNFVNGLDDQGI